MERPAFSSSAEAPLGIWERLYDGIMERLYDFEYDIWYETSDSPSTVEIEEIIEGDTVVLNQEVNEPADVPIQILRPANDETEDEVETVDEPSTVMIEPVEYKDQSTQTDPAPNPGAHGVDWHREMAKLEHKITSLGKTATKGRKANSDAINDLEKRFAEVAFTVATIGEIVQRLCHAPAQRQY